MRQIYVTNSGRRSLRAARAWLIASASLTAAPPRRTTSERLIVLNSIARTIQPLAVGMTDTVCILPLLRWQTVEGFGIARQVIKASPQV